MWKCPKCETLNNGSYCAVCGQGQPVVSNNQGNNTDYDEQEIVKKKSDNKALISVIVILSVIILLLAGLVVYNLSDNDVENEKQQATETATVTPKITETVINTPQPTVIPQKTFNEKIAEIRTMYYNTQDIIGNCRVETQSNGVKRYYNGNDLVRVDMPPRDGMNYTRNYYYNNGKMYFAFCFNAYYQHRMYFDGETLIRWINPDKVEFDNARDNADFIYWERELRNEASAYERG